MTKEDFWTHKIKAFLSTSPAISLFPDDEEQAKEFIATALGVEQDEIDLDSLKAVKTIAKGFDIPPFIENKKFSPEVFRENPLFKHPLSGEEIKLDVDLSGIDKVQINRLINDAIGGIRQEIIEIREKVKQRDSFELSDEEFHKRLFFALWRKLPDVIRQKENGEVKISKYWDWLPADTRIPTHSVWEHSSIVSAIAGTNSNPALLIFTIASPQQFISTARRTQDSWMGSFIYSFLMWEAIKHIADEFGPDCFLFPDLRRQPLVDKWLEEQKELSGLPHYKDSAFQIANFPNMLTAILPFDAAARLAQEADRKMKEKWEDIAGIISEKIEFALKNKLDKDTKNWKIIWDRQIKDFLSQNIFWVVCPWQNEGRDALEVYRRLFPDEGESKTRIDEFEKLLETVQSPYETNAGMMYQSFSSIASRSLTARKNLRDFHNHTKEEGEKCSLCGMRETLHPDSEPDYPARYPKQRDFWQNLGNIEEFEIEDQKATTFCEEAKFAGRIKRGDALCAVCLVKRLALDFYFNKKRENGFKFDRHLFPSTSTIATAPFKAKIIDWCFENPSKINFLAVYNQTVEKFLKKIKLYYPASAVPKLEKTLDEFSGHNKNIIRNFLRLDGQWLIKDSFYSVENELGIKFSEDSPATDLRDEAVKSLDELLKEFQKDFPTAKPSSYYAVISMDGDKIGDWLSGKNAPTIESLLHPDTAEELKKDSSLRLLIKKKRPLGIISHLSLSIILKNFALEIAPQIIEKENYGKLIFAGGDDLLAFVPVNNLLTVVNQLHGFFQGETFIHSSKVLESGNGVVRVKNSLLPERDILVAGTPQSEKNSHLTASLGIAIIHHSYPLPQAIEEAFTEAMKNNAKDKLGRNAVAFHLHKRAGDALKAGFKFDDFSASENALSILTKLLEFMKDGDLSSRIAYAMNERNPGLNGNWTDLTNLTKNPWWHKAQKQALRHLVSRQAKKSAIPEIEKNMISLLKLLYKAYRKPIDDAKSTKEKNKARNELAKKDTDTGWNTLTKLLLLLRFLAGEEGGEN